MDSQDTLDSNDDLKIGMKDDLVTEYDAIVYPSLVTRIKALFVDILIMLIIFTTTTLLIDSLGDIPSFIKGFIAIFMFYLYDPVLTAFTGSTLGHKLVKLKVRRFEQHEKNITFARAFLRFLAKALLGWLSFLTVTANKQKRAIHDLISGSVVLKDE